MVTIKDIAKEAGVSPAAVSYALNDSAQISKETRKKIMDIADEFNYVTNAVAKGLRTQKTKEIGVVVEDISTFNAPKIVNGISAYSENYDYHILLENLRLEKKVGFKFSDLIQHRKDINEFIRTLKDGRKIEGLIYIGHYGRDVRNIIDIINMPVIYTYCFNSNQKSSYSVNYDDQIGAYKIISYLIELGHKDIFIIKGKPNTFHVKQRLEGCKRAFLEKQIVFKTERIETGDWTYESGYCIAKKLLNKNIKMPSAFFAFNDLMAAGLIDGLKEAGYRVPEDISVAGFDNREFSKLFSPKLTTVDLPLQEMGKKSAEKLIKLIEGQKIKEKEIKLDCELILRESTGSFNINN